nr:MAG TPA: hypothetical protein [Caudoviricetes sp.]
MIQKVSQSSFVDARTAGGTKSQSTNSSRRVQRD